MSDESEQPIQHDPVFPMPSEWSDRTRYGKLLLLTWVPVWILMGVLLVIFLGSIAAILGAMYVLIMGVWKLKQAKDRLTPEIYKDE